jgi:D-alanyl-D-alanine carboxypeptidase
LIGFRWLGVVPICISACRPATSPNARLAHALSSLLDSALTQSPRLPGAMLRVEAPSLRFIWTKAVGTSEQGGVEPLRPDQTLRIASNTKTYVAAAILRLVEQGALALDGPIGPHLLPASVATLKRDGYDCDRITVRMLLQHTSGLFDYATTGVGSSGMELYGPFFDRIFADPGHRWTRSEQLALAIDQGDPYGAPGEVYHYSDTGYILLGEILETITGKPMATAVRELVDYQRHGIRAAYFETLEPVPLGAGPRTHQYMDSLDTNGFDASVDLYGGGGLVSDLEGMARFYRSLVRGEVLQRRETLDSMLAPSSQSLGDRPGAGYGMGIGRGEVDGLVCYGHGGFWGTAARHCPAIDLTVVAAVTNTTARAALANLTQGAIRLGAAAIAKPE